MSDNILSDLNMDYVRTCDDVLIELLRGIDEKLVRIEKLLTDNKQVNKTGHPKYKMFYDGEEITDKDLLYLNEAMELTIGEICKHFYYKDAEGNRIDDKKKCNKLIRNRLSRYEKN